NLKYIIQYVSKQSKQFLEHCLSSSSAVLMVCLSNLEHAHERYRAFSRACSINHAYALEQKNKEKTLSIKNKIVLPPLYSFSYAFKKFNKPSGSNCIDF
ncbi:hypothetical protein BpHYR1_023024, partial [Brachionus plicatilis]